MARSRVTDRDHGYAALKKRLTAAAKTTRLTVGIHEDDGAKTYPGGQTVAEAGSYNELGIGVPRRSFIADWVDETADKKRRDLREVARGALRGESVSAALERLGPAYVTECVARMDSLEPDAPETEEQKGGGEPLEETGLLRSSIKHRVTTGATTETE